MEKFEEKESEYLFIRNNFGIWLLSAVDRESAIEEFYIIFPGEPAYRAMFVQVD